ncbi:hypothetical protein VOLCADRAFT_61348 [Volvox carteri f. nagariensis]|uniref:Molybdopterin synthase catalytic subunit n=1 Tax=Volvox carteri f. nagariensis TaxID=3068 RepID=D8TY36_VOLCA|nr:uncharacterized protein VOLCADRAFT_61348 [Volvox carteri f. nagariensis]EFJ47576.1 hypothetical protein VOLCADRAFT_61348 [Volvox carteri f. nagariensis]|eukprot:XP_002951400.1 hypothetical protein VOLCADRAFT_61348 [Volvox carteri f. nagariensis]
MFISEENVFVEITENDLDICKCMELVADPGAGAISTFNGVTRNNFQGKTVIKLDYEAYVPMALKKLQELAHEVGRRWNVCKVAVAHRKGIVLVGEPSVIIAVSSAHRRESLEAVQWAIDELKAVVPIWKKEFFEDGSIWKENEESRRLLLAPSQPGTAAAAAQ